MAEQTIKLDSSAARKDLSELALALDKSIGSMKAMDAAFGQAATGIDRSMTKASKGVEKFANVMALVAKIKFNGDASSQIRAFAGAMNEFGNVKTLNPQKLASLEAFFKLLPTFKAPASGGPQLGRFFADLSKLSAPSTIAVRNLSELFKVLKTFGGAPASTGFRGLSNSLAQLKVPTSAQIARLQTMFKVLGEAKRIPDANQIARDLDLIAAASARAAVALRSLPAGIRGLNGLNAARGLGETANGLKGLNEHLGRTPGAANSARAGFISIGSGLDGLSARFKLSYQLGTAFTTLFSAFTLGAFVRSIYDTEISFQKFNKAMLFMTGTFSGARRATQDFVGIANELGLNFEKNSESIGRFAISSTAVGLSYKNTRSIYYATTLALQAAGASAEQAGYAFYGLSKMLSKGHVMSMEFNREIGQQIPGNAIAGARALSVLTGKTVSVGEFFATMRKGAIESGPFLIEWAKQIEHMYAPLKTLIQARPDVAVARLQTAFSLFKREVAESGFIGAFVNEINTLISKIVDSEGNLTAQAKKFADAIGRGLGDAVHALARGVEFVVDHLDQFVLGLKALAVFAIAAQFATWSNALVTLGATLQAAGVKLGFFASAEEKAAAVTAKATRATEAQRIAQNTLGNAAARGGVGAAERGFFAASATTGAAAGYGVSALSSHSNVPLGEAPETIFPRNASRELTYTGSPGAQVFALPAFKPKGAFNQTFSTAATNNLGHASGAAAAATTAGSEAAALATFTAGSLTVQKEFSLMGSLAKVASVGMVGLRLAMVALPGIAIAVAVAAAVFSGSLVTLGGHLVKVGGIISATLKEQQRSLGDLLGGAFGGEKDKTGHYDGAWIASVGAALVTVIDVVITAFTSLGKAIGTFIADKLIHGYELLLIAQGRFVDAKRLDAFEHTDAPGSTQSGYKSALQDLYNAGNYAEHRRNIINEAAKPESTGNQEDDVAQRQAEQALAMQRMERQAQAADAEKAQRESDRKYGLLGKPLSFEGVMKDIATGEDEARASFEHSRKMAADQNTHTEIDTAKKVADIQIEGAKTAAELIVNALNRGEGLPGKAGSADSFLTQPYSRDDLKKLDSRTPSNLVAKFQQASVDSGIPENYITRTAALESSFDPHARNKGKGMTTGGLFGETESYYKQYSGDSNASGRLSIDGSIKAFVTGTLEATKLLTEILGRKPTAGELREEHVLGPGGTANLYAGMGKNPNANGASTIFSDEKTRGLAVANNPFFASNGKKGAATLAEVDQRILAQMGEARGASGTTAQFDASHGASAVNAMATGAESEEDQNKAKEQRDHAIEELATIIRGVDPAKGAELDYQSFLAKIEVLGKADIAEVAKGGTAFLKTYQDEVAAAKKQAEQRRDDEKNPITKDIRLATAANNVEELRTKGLADDADWLVKINELKEKGYKEDEIGTKVIRDQWQAERDRADVLGAQIDLTKALNAETLSGLERSGARARDVNYAKAIAATGKPGQTYAQALQEVKDNPDQAAAIGKTVDVEEATRKANVEKQVNDSLSEIQATARLNSTAKTYRDDFKNYLKELTGSTSDSLTVLMGVASDSEKALAKYSADVKQAAENPPGFQKWADGLEPVAKRLEDIKASFAENLSTSITDALTGDKVDWRSMAHNLAKQLVKTQVDTGLQQLIYGATGAPGQRQPGQGTGGFLGSIGRMLGITPPTSALSAATSADATAPGSDLAHSLSDDAVKALGAPGASGGDLAHSLSSAAATAPTYTLNANIVYLNAKTLGGTGGSSGTAAGAANDNTSTAITDLANTASTAISSIAGGSGSGATGSLADGTSAFADQLGAIGGSGGSPSSSPFSFAANSDGGFDANALKSAAVLNPTSMATNLGSLSGVADLSGMTAAPDVSSMLAGFTSGPGGTGALGGSSGGNFLSSIMGMFGGGGGAGAAGGAGGGGGNFLSSIMGMFGGGGAAGGAGASGGGSGGGMNGLASAGIGILGTVLGLLTAPKKKAPPKPLARVNGIIGQMGQTTVNARQIAAHSNPIADILQMVASMAESATGLTPGGTMGKSLSSSLGSMFSGGGGGAAGSLADGTNAFASQLSQMSSMGGDLAIPAYAKGTPNTTGGGMLAVLHPDEAVIPLVDGRHIPVKMQGAANSNESHQTTIHAPIMVYAKDADSFKASQSSLARKQGLTISRAAARNLTGSSGGKSAA